MVIALAATRSPALDWEAVQDELARIADQVDEWFSGRQIEWTAQIAAELSQYALDLLRAADDALQGLSEEELAELEPWLRLAADHAAEIRELAPYAAWLRARLDYFAMAREAVGVAPAVPPTRAPTPPPPPWKRPSPPPPRAPPPPIRVRRAQTESSRTVWRKRAASAPPPPQAAALVPILKQSFQAEGVPTELVWLAQVESSLDPRARSPRGAAGLFQLMPTTAKSLGLRLDPEDEREHPERSARAAARLLRRLHGRFGSWPLALAAYNAGEGRIGAALRETQGQTFEDIAPALPVETRMYVPRVLEIIRLREGIDPDRLPPPG